MNNTTAQLIIRNINEINDEINSFKKTMDSETLFKKLYVVTGVFSNEIPEIQSNLLFREGTETRDAETVVGLLEKYLADNDIEYTEKETENEIYKKFWKSFLLWFEKELVDLDLIQDKFVSWSNWNGGTNYLTIDYDNEYILYTGENYPDSLKRNEGDIVEIKKFIEMAYTHWIKDDAESHYKFTIQINNRLQMFKLPYKLQNGKVVDQGYKSSYFVGKIKDYKMFERKIQYAEKMILSKNLMDKKTALDAIIDSLQYLISMQPKHKEKQELALTVNSNEYSKVYSVIKTELGEIMKISNEYFDIRHHDYLNSAKEKRESLNDSQFIEYLYNRSYALLYLLRLKDPK